MTPSEIRTVVERVLVQDFEIDVVKILPTASLRDELGLDSLDGLDFVVAIEREFSCRITEVDARSIRTVGDVCSMIEARLGSAGSTPA